MRFLIVIIVLVNSCLIAQELDFYKEDLTFRLNKNYFKVDGLYWFANHSDQNIKSIIYFPFSEGIENIDSVEVFNLTKGQSGRKLNKHKMGISFLLEAAPNDTLIYNIKYNQKITCDSVQYILLTTKYWNKPLETAEYKLIIEDSLKLTGSSYEPDKFYKIDGQEILYWRKQKFMPQKDFIFHFK